MCIRDSYRPALLPPQVRRRAGAGPFRGHGAGRDRPRRADGRTAARDPGDDGAGVGQFMAVAGGWDKESSVGQWAGRASQGRQREGARHGGVIINRLLCAVVKDDM